MTICKPDWPLLSVASISLLVSMVIVTRDLRAVRPLDGVLAEIEQVHVSNPSFHLFVVFQAEDCDGALVAADVRELTDAPGLTHFYGLFMDGLRELSPLKEYAMAAGGFTDVLPLGRRERIFVRGLRMKRTPFLLLSYPDGSVLGTLEIPRTASGRRNLGRLLADLVPQHDRTVTKK